MKNPSRVLIIDLYIKYGGTDFNTTLSESVCYILNKITKKEQYSKSFIGGIYCILKNGQEDWIFSNAKDSLAEELIKYIEKETLLFKLEMINEN